MTILHSAASVMALGALAIAVGLIAMGGKPFMLRVLGGLLALSGAWAVIQWL